MRIESYDAPLMLTWQLTRDCNLACLHCCTDSAPGRALPGELSRGEALGLAEQIVETKIPYVMLVGGEPTLVGHFLEVAEALGRGGVYLKIETNGQRFGEESARRLSALPIRSIQVSLDGATQAVYAKMRPGASLEKALEACRLVRRHEMPLEITFAPTRVNIHEVEAVIDIARGLGAFRFNTGMLMRVGTAAKLWGHLEPSSQEYDKFLRILERQEGGEGMELCFRPFSMSEEIVSQAAEPPGTLLILPDGKVKVSAALPYLCADLKRMSLLDAWREYRAAWRNPAVARELREVARDSARLARANQWIDWTTDLPAMV